MDMDDDAKFESLLKTINKVSGFQHHGYKRSYLRRRVNIRMRATRSSDYIEYGKMVSSDPKEVDLLLDRLTVNVTEFFRNREVFEILEKTTFPSLLSTNKKLKIWSAGSSEGREAYSIAMILSKILGNQAQDISITATDIDDQKLETGRTGKFKFMNTKDIEKELPDWALNMLRKDRLTVSVPLELRKMVRFVHHDLLKEEPLKKIDMVLCRNLLIYFPKEAQTIAMKKFHQALKKDGILVIGKTEHIPLEIKDLYKPLDLRQRIFMKVD
jgi:chemotaxis protein methyltransferase CheR